MSRLIITHIDKRFNLRLWFAVISAIYMSLCAGCSAGDMAFEDGASDYSNSEFAGETYDDTEAGGRSSETAPSVDSGTNEQESAGEDGLVSAGERGIGTTETPCDSSAYSDESDLIVCLDEIPTLAEEMVASNDSPDAALATSDTCDLADTLSELFEEQTGEMIVCEDLDNDCYYHCEGWTLPTHLQDPDDQRSFVTGVSREVDVADSVSACRATAQMTESGVCCPVNLDIQSFDRPDLSSENTPTLCRLPIPLADDSTLKLITTCQGGALMWISEDTEGQTLNFTQLSTPNSLTSFELDVQSYLLSSGEASIGEVNSLACIYTSEMAAMLVDTSGQLFYFGRGISGAYETGSMYTMDTSLGDVPLTALNWNTSALEVDDMGLFRWEVEVTQETDSLPQVQRYEDYAYGYFQSRGFVELSESVVQRALSCQNCRDDRDLAYLTSATLTTEGRLEITSKNLGSDQDMTGITLSPPLGFFDEFKSTSSVIGISSVDEAGVMGLPRRVTFSLWSDLNLQSVPIIFEASRWSFDHVNLISLEGGQALMSLISFEGDTRRTEFGLYDVYADRLSVIDPITIMTMYLDQIDLSQFKTPVLTSNKMLWLQTDQGQNTPEVITLDLAR